MSLVKQHLEMIEDFKLIIKERGYYFKDEECKKCMIEQDIY